MGLRLPDEARHVVVIPMLDEADLAQPGARGIRDTLPVRGRLVRHRQALVDCPAGELILGHVRRVLIAEQPYVCRILEIKPAPGNVVFRPLRILDLVANVRQGLGILIAQETV